MLHHHIRRKTLIRILHLHTVTPKATWCRCRMERPKPERSRESRGSRCGGRPLLCLLLCGLSGFSSVFLIARLITGISSISLLSLSASPSFISAYLVVVLLSSRCALPPEY